MGSNIRAFDWASHPLGPPGRWPVPLQTTMGVMLTTHHPMFIFWGPEHHCFYNDAYARSLGPEKHPAMLGGTAAEYWPEIWHIIGPQIDLVMQGRGATWHENQLVPIDRHGHRQDVYWTYGYSPIPDIGAAHGVGGVLVLCTETTDQVLTERRQGFLLRLEDALRSLQDPRQIIAVSAGMLGRHLEADRVGFGLVQPDDATIVLESNHHRGVAPLSGAYSLDALGAEVVARQRTGQVVAYDDVAAADALTAAAFASIGSRSVVSVPLIREGRLRATLFVNHREPRRWTGPELALIETVASRVWDSVERARAEADLKLARQRFELALRGSSIVAFSQDLGLRYTWIFNPSLGHTPAEIIGHTDRELFERPQDVDAMEALKREAIRTNHRRQAEVLVQWKGVDHYFDLLIDPVTDEAGAVTGITCVSVDITERKAAQRALLEADQRKDEFLAVLAHELRNPLAPMRAVARILGTPALPEERRQWAQRVLERQVKQMALLLDDLLDVARITQRKLDLRKQAVTLGSIVELAIETARPSLDAKSHRLNLSLPSQEVMLHVDPLRISQTISNLLMNAAKYTDPGGEVRLSARVDGNDLMLCVSDDGIGIAAESLERIFDMFSQADGGGSRSEGGLGIGLALVKGLVGLHSGTVTAWSEGVGRGSRFTVGLPGAVLAAAAPSSPSSPREAGAPPAARKRVLVADDNTDAADTLRELLEISGFEALVAHDGQATLSLAETCHPDIILLDIGMPDLSGYDVAAALRREPWGARGRLRLIALTGLGRESDRRRALEAGFDSHLTKPVDLDLLLTRLQ